MAGGYIYINGTYITDIVMDTFTVTNTGLLSSGYVTPVWTYSGSGTFLGFSATSGATTPDSNYVIGSTFTPTSTLYLYSVEATASNETYITSDIDLTSVANAIRTKGGTSTSLVYPAGYVSAINALPTGALQSYKSAVFTTPGSATLTPDSGYVGIEEISVEYSPSIYDGAYHTIVYPVKGDIIKIDMDGDNISEQYLVLNKNGTIFEVLSRSNIGNTRFGNNATYYNSQVDVLLNTTFYESLSTTAKAAIVDKTIYQDRWYYNSSSGNPLYNAVYTTNNTAYTISLENATYSNSLIRHIYSLSVQDIIDYLGATSSMTAQNTVLNYTNIRAMFNLNSSSKVWVWLRSASPQGGEFTADSDGRITYWSASTNTFQTRAAFQIDLSKIEWSFAS